MDTGGRVPRGQGGSEERKRADADQRQQVQARRRDALADRRRPSRACAILARPSIRRRRWNGQGEATAFAWLAFDRDVPAHEETELAAERQAETGAAIFAVACIVQHGELLEKARDLMAWNANPSIAHADRNLPSAPDVSPLACHQDGAAFRKLDCVVDQLRDHLLKFIDVGDNHAD